MIDRRQLNHGALPPRLGHIDALLVLAEQDNRDASGVTRASVGDAVQRLAIDLTERLSEIFSHYLGGHVFDVLSAIMGDRP